MSVRVTLSIFSGQPNPSWVLTPDQADQLQDRLRGLNRQSNLKALGAHAGLGYRGFLVSSDTDSSRGAQKAFVNAGIVDMGPTEPSLIDDSRDIESFLLNTAVGLDAAVQGHVDDTLKSRAAAEPLFATEAAAESPQPCVAVDAPAYDPSKWNVGSVQPYNNCYNYANNQITNTFAQPGKASGNRIQQLQNCAGSGSVQVSATSDGLRAHSNFSDPLTGGQGWYVALVVWPGQDFHWYRQDSSGFWSHKPGQTAVRNVDNSGQKIIDPKSCDRGPYTLFCTYMITKAGIVIK